MPRSEHQLIAGLSNQAELDAARQCPIEQDPAFVFATETEFVKQQSAKLAEPGLDRAHRVFRQRSDKPSERKDGVGHQEVDDDVLARVKR